MPILDKRKNQFIEDQDTRVSVGIDFPFARVPNQDGYFKTTKTTVDSIKNNIKLLLQTEQGERVFQPTLGMNLKQLLFEQQIDLESLKDKIIKQSTFYVANIQVIDVRTALSENESTLFVSITYRSLLDNTVDAVQLNFNN